MTEGAEGGLRQRQGGHRHNQKYLDALNKWKELKQEKQRIREKAATERQYIDALDKLQALQQVKERSLETSGSEIQTRIVGGNDAQQGKYPFMAVFDLGCGASLIAPEWLLSVAHCYEIIKGSTYAYIGSNQLKKGTRRKIAGVFVHPLYDDSATAHDYLLVKLGTSVDDINPVALNSDGSVPKLVTINKQNNGQSNNNNNNNNNLSVGESLTVIGFGVKEEGDTWMSGTLQEASVPYIPHGTCQSWYKNEVLDKETMFCAGLESGGVDSCQGDSGAPILNQKGVQVGTVSWGQGCARKRAPGVYARVSAALPWIHEVLCQHSSKQPSSYCIGSSGNGISVDKTNMVPSQVNRPETGHTIEINIQYDAFPQETAWVFVNSDLDTIVDSSVYGDATNPNEVVNIRYENQPSGSYAFVITDSVGNGICCNNGAGFVIISEILNDGSSKLIWAENGEFGGGTNVYFELSDSGTATATSTAKAPGNT